jgi:hypothetical protein
MTYLFISGPELIILFLIIVPILMLAGIGLNSIIKNRKKNS